MTSNKKLSDPTTKQARRRKVAAVLAGGLVLGVGTMATLASWNDSEFASATFTAGQFALESAVDAPGATWVDHSVTPGALTFSLPVGNLTPTDVVAAPFAVRLAAGTTNDAQVTLVASTAAGDIAPNLTYEVIKTTAANSCTTATAATDDNTAVVPANTAVDAVTGNTPFNINMGSPTSTAGAPAYLCFKVTAKSSLVQLQSGTVTWQLQAVSQ